MAPGPEVAMHTPGSPVSFAWAQAANAAISSWRTCVNSIRSPTSWNAPSRPLIPSPG